MDDNSPEMGVITRMLKQAATELGFSQVGICAAVRPPGLARFEEWLAQGFAGEMDYLSRRQEAYRHPESILSGAKSVVMLTLDYRTREPHSPPPGYGKVSRYAWGSADYHDLIHGRLKQLKQRVLEIAPQARARGVVDTAPLLERDFARLAGLGWQGKNSLLLSRTGGSWFFLAALILDIELTYDPPFTADHCGTCTACLDACPTAAFPQPRVLDARRCISYLTIEQKGPIPLELREGIGQWLFGCDVCQDVCPWQSKSRETAALDFQPRDDTNPLDLIGLFDLDDDAFRKRFRKTPLWRARRTGLLRNAAIVLGNQRCLDAVPALGRALRQEEAVVRGACAWALGQIGGAAALTRLQESQPQELDEAVQTEILRAMTQAH